MLRTVIVISLLWFLQSCAVHQHASPPSRAGYGGTAANGAQDTRNAHAGQWAVAIIGTPVYLAFKTVVCGASLVVAAPAAAVIALADSPYTAGVDELGDGIAVNCGPPYVLSPS